MTGSHPGFRGDSLERHCQLGWDDSLFNKCIEKGCLMESTQEYNLSPLVLSEREQELFAWLNTHHDIKTSQLQPMAGDASFRRYFRLSLANGDSFVVMDAPSQQENC